MSTYYNEIDPYCADWLRALMKEGHIPYGVVDERSIADVEPRDVAAFTHVHFFAGLGGWAYAMALAGWPADRPLWTGSCPCQPFSSAGKQRGDKDERHLWPEFFRLIAQCRPPSVIGEQVSSKLGRAWLAAVRTDLEGVGYAVGAADLGAASVGAPHIRQRLWWVADADATGRSEQRCCGLPGDGEAPRGDDADGRSDDGRLADAEGPGRQALHGTTAPHGRAPVEFDGLGAAEWVGVPRSARLEERPSERRDDDAQRAAVERAGGFWAAVEWLPCADDKSRPIPRTIESGFLLLADGFWYRVADVRAEYVAQAMKDVIVHAEKSRTRPEEVLFMVPNTYETQTLQRSFGGSNNFPSSEILLAFVRDIISALHRTTDRSGCAQASAQNDYRMLRDLRIFVEAHTSSLRRESIEQCGEQSSNAMLALSQFLARCGEASQYQASRTNAANFPLAYGVKKRTNLLKAAGNAIVPEVAAEVLKAAFLS